MVEVQRFKIEIRRGVAGGRGDSAGEYVLHHDYAALAAELKSEEAEHAMALRALDREITRADAATARAEAADAELQQVTTERDESRLAYERRCDKYEEAQRTIETLRQDLERLSHPGNITFAIARRYSLAYQLDEAKAKLAEVRAWVAARENYDLQTDDLLAILDRKETP